MEVVNEVRVSSITSLDELRISPSDFLDHLDGRSACHICGKSRKYFCYTCFVAVEEIADRVPRLKLPIKLDIIKHPKEVDGKSTACHAQVIAPDDVTIFTYPHIPNYEDKSKVLLLFPGKNAKTLKQLAESFNLDTVEKCLDDHCHRENNEEPTNLKTGHEVNLTQLSLSDEGLRQRLKSRFPFETIILIDSTWNQVRAIRKDERLKGFQKLELVGRDTLFWRFQRGKPKTYLSTIEAIYYLLVDLHTLFIQPSYQGEYDNLLFFFKYMFLKINSIYQADQLRVNRPISEFPIKKSTDANL